MSENVGVSSGCDLKGIIALIRIIKICCIVWISWSSKPVSVFSGTWCLPGSFSCRAARGCSMQIKLCPHVYIFHDLQQDKPSVNASLVTLCFMFVYLGLAYFAVKCGNSPSSKVSLSFMIIGCLHFKKISISRVHSSFLKMPSSLSSIIFMASSLRQGQILSLVGLPKRWQT